MSISAMASFAKPSHKQAARHLGYALTLGGFDAWHRAATIYARILTPEERAAAAWAFLATLAHNQREAVTSTLICDTEPNGAGMPQAPLFNHMDQAAFWADMAEPDELDAYTLAGFNRMHPGRQAAFIAFVQRQAVA